MALPFLLNPKSKGRVNNCGFVFRYIGVFFLLTYNMLYAMVNCYEIIRWPVMPETFHRHRFNRFPAERFIIPRSLSLESCCQEIVLYERHHSLRIHTQRYAGFLLIGVVFS